VIRGACAQAASVTQTARVGFAGRAAAAAGGGARLGVEAQRSRCWCYVVIENGTSGRVARNGVVANQRAHFAVARFIRVIGICRRASQQANGGDAYSERRAAKMVRQKDKSAASARSTLSAQAYVASVLYEQALCRAMTAERGRTCRKPRGVRRVPL